MSEEQNIPEQKSEDQISKSESINEISQSQIINPQSEIENMEVHKHPHRVTHKKKWGEYL